MINHPKGYYEKDRIHTPPSDTEGWSENLLVWGYDPIACIGLFTHMGRMTNNSEIWEGVTCVVLPNGEVLAHRSMGANRSEAVINNEYRYTPVVPGQTWHYHFNGMAQRAKSVELGQRLMHNEPYESLSFELIFDGVHPTFDFDDSMQEQGWASMHLEQAGTLKGVIHFGGKEHIINCMGNRDHSAGPRDYDGLLSETWAQCAFPSGRCFSAIEITEVGRPPLRAGHVFDQGKMSALTITGIPALEDTLGNPHKFAVTGVSDGKEITLIGEMIGPYMPLTLPLPTGICLGFKADSPHLTGVIEAPAKYIWDGEEGYGWIERIRRVDTLNQSFLK